MKIVIPGGSGQVGTMLARALAREGHDVVVLSRGGGASKGRWRTRAWDGATLGAWVEELEGADAVVNLAGRSVDCRYTAGNREEIMRSRVDSRRAVGRAIERSARAPRVWLQMSTATIYSHRFDAPNDDVTGRIGSNDADGAPDAWRFSLDVANAWEKAANDARLDRTRLVLMRSAMVMSPDAGGVFDTLLRLVRFGLGGRAASGRQYVSWIHERDFVRAVEWLVARDDLSGAVAVASPGPLANADFMRALRRAWGTPVGLPSPEWMLEIGARLIGTETELILKSRRVVPARLVASGFEFEFDDWARAAEDLCARWRRERERAPGRLAESRS